MASPGRAMPALRMLEDAVKSAVTLRDVAAAWKIFCTSLSGEGGGGRQEESEKGPPKSELISGLHAAICMYKPVFAYASIQLCIQPLAMLKQRQACACLMDPAQSLLAEIWLLLLPNSETNHHGKYLKI